MTAKGIVTLLAILLIAMSLLGVAGANNNSAVVKDPQGTVLFGGELNTTSLTLRTNLANAALLGDGVLLNLNAVSKPLDVAHLPLNMPLPGVHLSLLSKVEGVQKDFPSADIVVVDSSAEPINLV